MVPIHDTDIAESRWTKAEWENYELWEKVETRVRRRKRLWISGTVVLFLAISSVPIIRDRFPKWKSLNYTRRLAQEINRVKREANTDHVAYQIRFEGDGSLGYQIEKLTSCDSSQATFVRSGVLSNSNNATHFAVISAKRGNDLGVPGLAERFCYDPLKGSDAANLGGGLLGFGIGPVKDLTEGRIDRISVLLLSGPVAEVSFD